MLRQAQHERKLLGDFNTTPVHPEPVEGRTCSIAKKSTILIRPLEILWLHLLH